MPFLLGVQLKIPVQISSVQRQSLSTLTHSCPNTYRVSTQIILPCIFMKPPTIVQTIFKLLLGKKKKENQNHPNLTAKVAKGAHSKKSSSVLSYIYGIAVSNIFKCIHFNRTSNILYKRWHLETLSSTALSSTPQTLFSFLLPRDTIKNINHILYSWNYLYFLPQLQAASVSLLFFIF